jgi:hypothetical protein
MPVKLPAPDFGTLEQAGPKSAVVVLADELLEATGADEAAAGDDVDPEAAVLELDELQAAPARATPTATPDRPISRRFFTVFSLSDIWFSI